jgi:chromatin segregation and condensation protein Rec8/ScpA/Scc1 (kleisin family)
MSSDIFGSLDINNCIWYRIAIIICIGILIYLIIYPKQMKCGLFMAVLGVIVTHFLYRGCIQTKTEGFEYDRELYKRVLKDLIYDNDIKDLKNNHIKNDKIFNRIFDGIVEILYQTNTINKIDKIDTTQDKWMDKVSWDSSFSNMRQMINDVRNRKDTKSDRGNHKNRDAYKNLVNIGASNNDVKNFRNDMDDLLESNSDRNRIAARMIRVIELMIERAAIILRLTQNNTNKMKDTDKTCDGITKPITCPLCSEKPFCTSTGWACPSMWTKELPMPSVKDRCLGVS